MKKHFSIILLLLCVSLAQDVPYFDGTRAMNYLTAQCEFGPRYPGSEGYTNVQKYYENFLKPLADDLMIMPEKVVHPRLGTEVNLTNYLVRFNPDVSYRLLFLAHYDTRDIADMDTIPENQSKPIIGANDGASGIAILMTLAEILRDNPVQIGVDLLFVDGEDMGVPSLAGSYGLGTKEFSKKVPRPYPAYAVGLDMVGDAELNIPVELYSYYQANSVVMKIWGIAEDLGYHQFSSEIGRPIYDDHRVLWEHTKIPSVDIIDFDYPNPEKNYWHTLEDTADKCSAASLEAVGSVITTLIYLENGMNR